MKSLKSAALRPRFSLRTMFIVVTLVAVGLGWLLRPVYQRRAERIRIEQHGGLIDVFSPNVIEQDLSFDFPSKSVHLKLVFEGGQRALGPEEEPQVPRWRRWFGDEAYNRVILPEGASQSDLNRARALFPEAEVDVTQAPTPGSGFF